MRPVLTVNRWRELAIVALRSLALACAAIAVAGCAAVANNAASGFAGNLSDAILDQDDPQIVRDGAPAYLLLLDSLAAGAPDNPDLVGAAAELYALYGVVFVDDPERAQRLTTRARLYGRQALCAADSAACEAWTLPFEDYERVIGDIDADAAGALFSYSVGSLAYIRANSADFTALADLPKAEIALNRLLEIGESADMSSINLYLGVLNSLRPPALGGEPEKGRRYFETAIDLSDGQDLGAKVEYARGYARLVYDRELHDQLLSDVLVAEPDVPGLTLFNHIAQQQAAILLDSADDYF